MINFVRTWFDALSSREKILISVLAILVAGFIAFYGVFKPFVGAMNEAELRYQEAVERQARIEIKAAFFDAKDQGSEGAVQSAAGSIETIISRSAGEAGFATSAINTQSDNSVTMTIDSAKPTAMFHWIALLEQRGIIVVELLASPGANETITATLKLR
ncbi:MAG: type II secretion system protein GspM [Parasphingorhabdus sp.]